MSKASEARRIPFKIKDKIKLEVKELVKKEIITENSKPSC